MFRWFCLTVRRVVVLNCVVSALVGCALPGPGPELFPVTPMVVRVGVDGSVEQGYDTTGDGKADCSERVNATGVVEAIRFDDNKDGCLDDRDAWVVLADVPEQERRHLIMILDSVPFAMVESLWAEGRFRLFSQPSRVISPFPVMTDLCLSDFFGVSPCPGVESEYFDGEQLRNGYVAYASKENVPWMDLVDWHLEPATHVSVYLGAKKWYLHELRQVQEHFRGSGGPRVIAYIVGTSALGARVGRDGHQAGLIQLDRFCRQLVFESRGRVRISLLSDHGHHYSSSKRIPLSRLLAEFGYRPGRGLERSGDVVVPEFGMVSCAVIHTREAAEVARDVLGIEGVELTAYRDASDNLVVLSRTGRARITHSAGRFAYRADFGDPLDLLPIYASLRAEGKVDADGFAGDGVLKEATATHSYPDVVHRLWRAFHGLVQHTPDVLVSTQDGYHCGSAFMSSIVHLTAAHGNLRRPSSTGFSMSMNGRLPEMVRMEDLRGELVRLGVPLDRLESRH
ncbi:MAG TPA: hypothetical protein PLL20_00835 [Phycisphaerae bacterium]|nr:hypothetical protein [Phycisphaerae bacterium]